jgi:hypothetical protein
MRSPFGFHKTIQHHRYLDLCLDELELLLSVSEAEVQEHAGEALLLRWLLDHHPLLDGHLFLHSVDLHLGRSRWFLQRYNLFRMICTKASIEIAAKGAYTLVWLAFMSLGLAVKLLLS